MLSIRDADDCVLGATVEVDRWQREFMAAWYAPYLETTAAVLYRAVDQPTRNELARRVPDAVKMMEAGNGK